MNEDTLVGEGRTLLGKAKEGVGDLTGNRRLQGEGIVDQFGGQAQKVVGTVRDAINKDAGPMLEKAKQFARERPFAVATLAGVLGLAVLNGLRGKR